MQIIIIIIDHAVQWYCRKQLILPVAGANSDAVDFLSAALHLMHLPSAVAFVCSGEGKSKQGQVAN